MRYLLRNTSCSWQRRLGLLLVTELISASNEKISIIHQIRVQPRPRLCGYSPRREGGYESPSHKNICRKRHLQAYHISLSSRIFLRSSRLEIQSSSSTLNPSDLLFVDSCGFSFLPIRSSPSPQRWRTRHSGGQSY